MRTNPFHGNTLTLDDYRKYLDSILDSILNLVDGESVRVF